MEEGILTAAKSEELVLNVLKELVTNRGYEKVKANAEGYDTPAKLTSNGKSFIPDIVAKRAGGGVNYFEIALKTDKVEAIGSKWRLLSELAKMKGGKFTLVVPYGNLRFVNDVLKRFYEIDAKVVKVGFKA